MRVFRFKTGDPSGTRAFTLLELCVVIATVFISICLAALLLTGAHPHRTRINCAYNLKQVALAALIWSGDNSDRLPMQVSTNQGGSKEFTNVNNAFRHFQTMSNELNNPRFLVCSEDPGRSPATNFLGDLNNDHLSYFINLNADIKLRSALLSGDRFITNDLPLRDGTMTLVTNRGARWTKSLHQIFPRTNYLGVFPRHVWGNIVVRMDGTMVPLDSAGLAKFLAESGVATNRLLVP